MFLDTATQMLPFLALGILGLLPSSSPLCPPGQGTLGRPHLDCVRAMKPDEVRTGMRVKVRECHRIEKRRGLVGEVVGTYGGEEFVAVEVLFADGQRRLFWPADLQQEVSSPHQRWWWWR